MTCLLGHLYVFIFILAAVQYGCLNSNMENRRFKKVHKVNDYKQQS